MTTRIRSLSTLFSISSRLRVVALMSLFISVAGCGGGGGGSSDDFNPSNPCNVVLTIVTAGLSCALGVIAGVVPTTPTSPSTATPTPSPTPAEFRFQNVTDLEPNDDLTTASAAYFPMRAAPEQRVGFRVDGSINDLLDSVDTFSFSSTESRTLRVGLCVAVNTCGATYRVDIGAAFIEVLDQFGTTLWTTEDDQTAGNLLNIAIDSGVLYYIAVVAENTSGSDMGYFLNVVETSDPVDPMTPQTLIPSAPLLSVSGAPSRTVILDWVPPSTNTDGSALLDLSGYTISYADVSGPCCGNYPTTEIDLDNLGLVAYVLDLPGPGDWSISMTARTSSGQVSAASNVVTVSVDDAWTIPGPGQVVSYHFSTGASTGGMHPVLGPLFAGAVVAGTFDYDNGAPAMPSWEYTEYPGSLVNLTGSVNGSGFSDFDGSAIVSNDRYGPPTAQDILSFNSGALYFAGFEMGGYTLVGVRIFWLEEQNGVSDFLTSEDLLTAPPGFEGRLALDFVSTTDPTDRPSVFFNGVFVTPTG